MDVLLWCICADFIAFGDHGAAWVLRGAVHARRGKNECESIIHAASWAMTLNGDRSSLDRLACAILLNACPSGDGSSGAKQEQERRVAGLRREIRNRWYRAAGTPAPDQERNLLPEPPGLWEEYGEQSARGGTRIAGGRSTVPSTAGRQSTRKRTRIPTSRS